MNELEKVYFEILDSLNFDEPSLDYSLLDKHIGVFNEISSQLNIAITIYDAFKREHVFASQKHKELFGSDGADDSEIHPEDYETVFRNAIASMRHFFSDNKKAKNLKLLREYRAHAFSSIIIATALTLSVIYYLITGTHTIIELAIIIFIFNIGFGGHTLIALRNIMSEYPSQRSYTSASMNFLNHISAYIASVLVQVLFTFVSSAMQIHTIMAVFFIVLIILSFLYFRRTISNNESMTC